MPLLREDPALLRGFRSGDSGSLAKVYRFYVRKVHAQIRALAKKSHADDLAQPSIVADLLQDVFVRAFSDSARRSYDANRDFGPYLAVIARNCFVDLLRKRGREVLLGDQQPTLDDPSPASIEDYDPRMVSVLRTYVSQLPGELRVVYEQRFVMGRSQEEACDKLGLSRGKLRTREEHLRMGLKRALVKAGVYEVPEVTSAPVRVATERESPSCS